MWYINKSISFGGNMRFIKSFCTNTRLMGTMMLMIEWSRNNKVVSHVFMLDAEGLGVSDFYSYDDLTVEERETFYKKKYGGLGGTNVNLTESEAVFLVIYYINKNINYNKNLPEKMSNDIVDFYMKSQGESLEQEILQYEGMCCYENCEKDKNFKRIIKIVRIAIYANSARKSYVEMKKSKLTPKDLR